MAGCAKETEEGALAKVGGRVITEEDLEERLAAMPPFVQQQLQTPDGRQRLLTGLVEEEAIVREARALGLDRTEEFRTEIEQRERDALVRLYYEQVIEAEATPTDAEIEEFYEAHREEYKVPESVWASHILVDTRAEANRIRNRLEGGEDFSEVAKSESKHADTAPRGGEIGAPIQQGSGVRGLGVVPEFVEVCFQLELGQISQPVKTSMGYHIVRVDRREPETVKPLEEVRQGVLERIKPTRRSEVRDRKMEELKAKYGAVFFENVGEPQTPQEFFERASDETSPTEKIRFYREFLERFPENERAYEAKFMIGFVYSEELGQYDAAEKEFQELLRDYPDNDLADDARWMMENMRSEKEPEFEE
jgi:peptidyl-prolyl cis-trans isomerase C